MHTLNVDQFNIELVRDVDVLALIDENVVGVVDVTHHLIEGHGLAHVALSYETI